MFVSPIRTTSEVRPRPTPCRSAFVRVVKLMGGGIDWMLMELGMTRGGDGDMGL